jgi:hypothetical protein
MWAERGFSQGSSLDRDSGPADPQAYAGLSCWNCGEWRSRAAHTRIQMVGRELERLDKFHTQRLVAEFYDLIADQRRKKVAFETIARQLTQAGHRCNDKTLQKYFLLERIKRGGDGETSKTT